MKCWPGNFAGAWAFSMFPVNYSPLMPVQERKKQMKNRSLSKTGLAAALLIAGLAPVRAADWPQYRGPDHNGISTEKILGKWPAGGPRQVWKAPTPLGFSSFAVAEGKACIQVVRSPGGEPREMLVAFDAATGRQLWATDIGSGRYDKGGDAGAEDNKGGDGPRSTPVINGGKVYAYTQNLVLFCLDGATGKVVWKKDILQEYQGRNIQWKSAMSPLVDGNLVFVGGGGPGQSLLAFNKTTGQLAWKAHNETITHSTPVAADILGVRQVIFFLKSGLLAVSPQNGQELWRFPFPFKVSTAISPVVCGDIVYCSAGYGVGGGACKISKAGAGFKATELWKKPGDRPVANHWSTPVHKDGHLYGMFSFKEYGRGPLKCVAVRTGEVKWSQDGFGPGNVILAGNQLVALSDAGQVVLVEATPAGYKESARAKVLDGKCWSTPALSNGRLYLRSTKEGVCLDIAP